MKLNVILLMTVGLLASPAGAQEQTGRYQLVVAQAASDWMMPSMVFKIDTVTGQTWRYEFGNVPVGEKYRSQWPKGVRVNGWTPIPESYPAEVHKVLDDFLGYLKSLGYSSSPAKTP